MTTPTPDQTPHRGLPIGRLLLGVLAGFTLVFAFGVGALFAYQGQYEDRIYPGVTVAGVDVAGLSREDAAARLETALAGYATGVAVVEVDGTPLRISYASLGRRADVDALVELAWSVGRGGSDPVGRAAQGVRSLIEGTEIGPVVVLDPAAVARSVAQAATAIDRPAVDATATATKDGFDTTPAVTGRGLPREAVATALLATLADPAAPDTLSLTFASVPVDAAVTDADAEAAVAAATRMARDVKLTHAKDAWKIKAATVRSWIRFETAADGTYRPVVAETAPTKSLASLAKKIDTKPKDASFLVGRGGARVGVVAGKNGRKLDVDASAPLVAAAVNERAAAASDGAPPAVAVAVTVVKPKLTTEEAKKAAPLMRRLSSWTTYYEVSERNGFGNNISIPTRDINGYVVRPGAVFDFWAAVGPVTYERGYRDGGAILNGRTEPTGALAGGICSCSTTLFNAAARAGLEILDRDNHYYYISRYPTGLDATVWKTGSSVQSMRFRNDTKFPILVRGYASPGRVTFEIWGPPTGRKTSFSAPTIRNVLKAVDTVQYTTTLPAGTQKRIEYPVNGMQVWVTRIVRDAKGRVIHEDTWYSDYKRVNGILLIGKKATAPKPSPGPSATPGPSPTPAP